MTAIDNNGNAVIITNRKVRSLVRLKDKREGEILSLRSKCVENSNRYRHYTKAIYKIKAEFDRKIRDAIHKQTKLFLDYCIKNNVGKIFYGDLDTTTRNSKGRLSKKINHKLNMWRFGQLVLQLENKLSRCIFINCHNLKLKCIRLFVHQLVKLVCMRWAALTFLIIKYL